MVLFEVVGLGAYSCYAPVNSTCNSSSAFQSPGRGSLVENPYSPTMPYEVGGDQSGLSMPVIGKLKYSMTLGAGANAGMYLIFLACQAQLRLRPCYPVMSNLRRSTQ